MSKAISVLRKVLTVILVLVLAGNLYFIGMRLAGVSDNPKLFGFFHALVLSGSMEPEFSPGDMLLYREAKSYGVGDVVMFRAGGSFVTHRIVGESEGSYVTQGDANNAPDDGLLRPENIEGKYLCVLPLMGPVAQFTSSTLGSLVLILVAVALWVWPENWHLISGSGKRKKGKYER